MLGLRCDAGFDSQLSLRENTRELFRLLEVDYRDPGRILFVERERGLLLEGGKKLREITNASFLSLVLY